MRLKDSVNHKSINHCVVAVCACYGLVVLRVCRCRSGCVKRSCVFLLFLVPALICINFFTGERGYWFDGPVTLALNRELDTLKMAPNSPGAEFRVRRLLFLSHSIDPSSSVLITSERYARME